VEKNNLDKRRIPIKLCVC